MSEQARFQEWWESTGTNSVILRAQAWSAWLARAEADQPQQDPHIALMEAEHEDRMQPQPAEDPDEWVILDPVKYANHVPRVGIDQFERAGKDVWITQENNHTAQKVGAFFESCGAYHRCRRRDLPKVEQAEQCAACDAPAEPGTAGCKDCNEYATAICSPEPEQWPKYYKPSQPRKTGFGKHVAYYKCSETEKGETVHTDGTSFRFSAITPGCEWTEITEEQAMWLLDQPKEPESKPQPQKTRVRLWMHYIGGTVVCGSRPSEGWQEIHHDSEGFYVEGRQS